MSISIVMIVGARPQFVKMASVCRAIDGLNEQAGRSLITFESIHTGQHFDSNMSDVFFTEMSIPAPDHNLGINAMSHGAMTGAMLASIEEILVRTSPDLVLVFGDTNSTLAGSLAAVQLHIPLGHVEAGLRSFNRRMPEEINRMVSDQISDMLFTPTRTAVDNLCNEGHRIADPSDGWEDSRGSIYHVGDVMYDSIKFYTKVATDRSRALDQLGLSHGDYALATVHRAENTDERDRLTSILTGLDQFSRHNCPVVLPLHPRTRKAIERHGIELSDVRAVDPVSYFDMLVLERHAQVVFTDSGGVQKEAFWFGVPCVTLRDETEWMETVEAGKNTLVGADLEGVVRAIDTMKNEVGSDGDIGLDDSLWDGRAADRIVQCIMERF